MIRTLQIFSGDSVDPYYNLAVEQSLLERVAPDCCTLYLWQNRNTVVIGRNQNAWKECRTALLESEGGRLARRLSGGGAVFHDLGNLNFTFLLPTKDFDVTRQLSVICDACHALGIPATISGRNDMLAEGYKFSGSAFYRSGESSYHHGTLLVDVDMERMERYLSPSKAKLASKSVASVRSRVVNLREYVPNLTIRTLAQQLERSFETVYGLSAEKIDGSVLDAETLEAYRRRNQSPAWLYGSRTPISLTCEARFAWGELQIQLQAERGVILQARVYSDAMDWTLAPRLEKALTGCRFSLPAMQEAVCAALPHEAEDIVALLAAQLDEWRFE